MPRRTPGSRSAVAAPAGGGCGVFAPPGWVTLGSETPPPPSPPPRPRTRGLPLAPGRFRPPPPAPPPAPRAPSNPPTTPPRPVPPPPRAGPPPPRRSTDITPLPRSCGPIRHPLAFSRFPGVTGDTAYLAPAISRRDERASPVAQHVLVTVLSLPPRQGEPPYQSVFGCSCCLRPMVAGSALGNTALRGHTAFTFVTARCLVTSPEAVLSIGFEGSVAISSAIQTTGL